MTSGRPSQRAPQYITLAPTQEPSVAATTTPAIDSSPWVRARYAAGGTTVSLGIGTIVLSSAMRAPMSQYPP